MLTYVEEPERKCDSGSVLAAARSHVWDSHFHLLPTTGSIRFTIAGGTE